MKHIPSGDIWVLHPNNNQYVSQVTKERVPAYLVEGGADWKEVKPKETEMQTPSPQKADMVNYLLVNALKHLTEEERITLHNSLGERLLKHDEKEKLFVTADGYEIFKEDCPQDTYFVSPNFHITLYRSLGQGEILNQDKIFKDKAKAEEYVLMNAPKLSINDIYDRYSGSKTDLKDLVKSRL